MSTDHEVDIRPMAKIESVVQVPTNGISPSATSAIGPGQVYALMAYYMALLASAIALIVVIVLKVDLTTQGEQAPRSAHLLASMGFLASGAVVGSVLYQIRMLFRHYVKDPDFDSKWMCKYISAPIEAVGLALAIVSLIQGGALALGGGGFDLSKGQPFAAFGFGALVGFGIREVVGWLANLARTTFPAEQERT